MVFQQKTEFTTIYRSDSKKLIYLQQFHDRNWVKKVKSTKKVWSGGRQRYVFNR